MEDDKKELFEIGTFGIFSRRFRKKILEKKFKRSLIVKLETIEKKLRSQISEIKYR